MELIVGTRRITPASIRVVPGGVCAELAGDAMRAVLDAAFHGQGTIELSGGRLNRHPVAVTGIEMHGATSRVTLICSGRARSAH